jgi:hypothetical protein
MRKKRHEAICSLRNSKDHDKYAAFFIAQWDKEGLGEKYENIIAMLNDNLLQMIGPRCHLMIGPHGPTDDALVHDQQQELENQHDPVHGALADISPESITKYVCASHDCKPGHPILYQFDRYFNSSYILILLITEDFRGVVELTLLTDNVRLYRKPVLFMLMGSIDARDYVPQELHYLCHKENVFKLKEGEDGKLEPETSWADICNFILDNAANCEKRKITQQTV